MINRPRPISTLGVTLALVAALGVSLPTSGQSSAQTTAIVDSLGSATPDTVFQCSGQSGLLVSGDQIVGPEIDLVQTTALTEIGAFLVSQGNSQPFTVEIHPANATGAPGSAVLASFVLSDHHAAIAVPFEKVAINLTLGPGRYFALFGSQGGDQGFLLGTCGAYVAQTIPLGVKHPTGGTPPTAVGSGSAAVRVLGRPFVAADSKVSLNGKTAYAEAPHADELNLTGSWTAEAWFRDMNPSGFDHPRARILAKGDTANAEVPYFLGIERNSLFAGFRAGGSPYAVSYDLRAHNVNPNVGHHVASTFNGSTGQIALYLDGVMVARATVPARSFGNTLPVGIGRSGPNSGEYWQGLLDDVRIWNIVRTPAEIAASFRNEIASEPGLVGSWLFNEGMGNTAADSAGSAQQAVLLGGATWSATP